MTEAKLHRLYYILHKSCYACRVSVPFRLIFCKDAAFLINYVHMELCLLITVIGATFASKPMLQKEVVFGVGKEK